MDEDFNRLWALAQRLSGPPLLSRLMGVSFSTIVGWCQAYQADGTPMPQLAANYLRCLHTKTTDGLATLISQLGARTARAQIVDVPTPPNSQLRPGTAGKKTKKRTKTAKKTPSTPAPTSAAPTV